MIAKYKLFTGILLLFMQLQLFAQITKQYEDKQYDRTNIVKEEGTNDYQILEERFADAEVGKVVRIGIEKPKKNNNNPAKPDKTVTTPKESPRLSPQPKARQSKSGGSGGSGSSQKASRKKKKTRLHKVKKRKKVPARKKWSCYHF